MVNLIVGAGAVGCVMAHYLLAAGQPVRMFVGAERLARHANTSTLKLDVIDGKNAEQDAPPVFADLQQALDGCERLFLCVKHRDLPALLTQLSQHLPSHVLIVPCLNGVGIRGKIKRELPKHQVAPISVMFNAALVGPLHAQLTTGPELWVDTNNKPLLRTLKKTAFKVARTDESAAWGKLLINLNNAVCALTHSTFKTCLTDPALKRCFVGVMDEAVQLYDEAGIKYRLPVPLPYRLYRRFMLHGGPGPWLVAKMKLGLSDQAYPSMVADINAKRSTEVQQLNGEVVALAEQLQTRAPLNHEIMSMIQQLEIGRRKMVTPAELLSQLQPVLPT